MSVLTFLCKRHELVVKEDVNLYGHNRVEVLGDVSTVSLCLLDSVFSQNA